MPGGDVPAPSVSVLDRGYWTRLPEGYTARYDECPDGTYWKLYFEGERINGGVAECEEDAVEDAARYARQHDRPHSPPVTLDIDAVFGILKNRRKRDQSG